MSNSPELRELKFDTLEMALEDAERLAAGEVRTTGNHTFGQILEHLALSHDVSAGKVTAPAPPFFMKLMMPLIRRMVINSKPLKPGIKLPKKGESFFWPAGEVDVNKALEHLRDSVAYLREHGPLEKHPMFGAITPQQAEELNCRHCALHLSFVHPVQ